MCIRDRASPMQTNMTLLKEMRHDIYFCMVTGFGRAISAVSYTHLDVYKRQSSQNVSSDTIYAKDAAYENEFSASRKENEKADLSKTIVNLK